MIIWLWGRKLKWNFNATTSINFEVNNKVGCFSFRKLPYREQTPYVHQLLWTWWIINYKYFFPLPHSNTHIQYFWNKIFIYGFGAASAALIHYGSKHYERVQLRDKTAPKGWWHHSVQTQTLCIRVLCVYLFAMLLWVAVRHNIFGVLLIKALMHSGHHHQNITDTMCMRVRRFWVCKLVRFSISCGYNINTNAWIIGDEMSQLTGIVKWSWNCCLLYENRVFHKILLCENVWLMTT